MISNQLAKNRKREKWQKNICTDPSRKKQLGSRNWRVQTRNVVQEVVEPIKIARSYGDLSRRTLRYEAAKDEQAFIEGQIQILEAKIRYAEIVDSDAVANDEVAIGKTVVIARSWYKRQRYLPYR